MTAAAAAVPTYGTRGLGDFGGADPFEEIGRDLTAPEPEGKSRPNQAPYGGASGSSGSSTSDIYLVTVSRLAKQ